MYFLYKVWLKSQIVRLLMHGKLQEYHGLVKKLFSCFVPTNCWVLLIAWISVYLSYFLHGKISFVTSYPYMCCKDFFRSFDDVDFHCFYQI
jgi:hypothetical protein